MGLLQTHRSKTLRTLIAGLFVLVGLEGCAHKDPGCQVVGSGIGIVRYLDTSGPYDKYAGDPGRGEAPGVCGTVEVDDNPLESAAGFVMVNAQNQVIGTAPSGSKCAATTSKCSAPGTSSGCGRSTPKTYCRHTYVQLDPGNSVNPCTCTCQP